MTPLRKAKADDLKKLFLADPELEKHVQKDKDQVLVLTASESKIATDPLLQVELSLRKCERLGLFEK